MTEEDEKSISGIILIIGVLGALFYPSISSYFVPFLQVSLFFLVIFSFLPLARYNLRELTDVHAMVPILVFWQQLVLPAATLLLGVYTGVDRHILFLTLVVITSGSLFASPTLVHMMGLDRKIAVQTVFLSTLATPFSILIPFWFLNDSTLEIDLQSYAIRVLVFLFVPVAVLSYVKVNVRRYSEDAVLSLERWGRRGAILALLVFCLALEGQVGTAISDEPETVLKYLVLSIVVSAVTLLLTRGLMSRFGSHAALTAGMVSSFRNVGLTYGLVAASVDHDLSVFIGVCQIPMFFAPFVFDLFSSEKLQVAAMSSPRDAAAPSNGGEHTSAPNGVRQAHKLIERFFNHETIKTPRTREIHTALYASLSPTAESAHQGTVMASGGSVGNTALAIDIEESEALEAEVAPVEDPQRLQGAIVQLESLRSEAARQIRDLKGQFANSRQAVHYILAVIILAAAGTAGIWHANKYFFATLFDQQLIEEIAATHVAGKNFGVFDLNLNIRDLRNATIARMEKAPEAVVLGASHWQEAHVNLVTGKEFYNSHVHRDYYEDMLAVTEMYLRHDKLPKEMIITIRDNLFTPIEYRTDFLWLPGIKYYRKMAERLGIDAHSPWETLPVNTWRELVSLPLLWSQATRQILAPVQPHATSERHFDTLDTLLPGGSILWSGEHRRLFTQERARREALAFAAARRNDPPRIDPKGVDHFEALLRFLTDRGVKITLAHPPFNPIYWDAVQGSPYMDGLDKVKALTKGWADKYNLPIIGGFDPATVGCTSNMYIDAEHSNPKCLGMLLGQYNRLGSQDKLGQDFTLRGSVK